MTNVGAPEDIPAPPDSPAGRRLGLLGGTFDPPHIAHVSAAATVRHALGLDEVWLVVANRPWQKAGTRAVSPAEDRFAMVEAAVDGVPGIAASRLEIDRGGETYTADTLAILHEQDPTARLFLVVGGDAAAGLSTWKRPDEVRARCELVVVDRPGQPGGEPPDGWACHRVTMPRLDVSSTGLRALVAQGRPIDGLTPAGVCAVIRERRLYGGAQV